MNLALKASVIRKQIGNVVYVRRRHLPFYGTTFVEDTILEVVGKNVYFENLDWMHFDQISEIRTEKPVE